MFLEKYLRKFIGGNEMSRIDEINELISKRQSEPSQARARIEKLFDPHSFVELGTFNYEAGVVTGFGTINGKLVYAYSQEKPVNFEHAKKISNIYELALKMGSPVIGIMDSKGMVLEDGMGAFEAYGIIFKNQSSASGVVPQISIVVGDCIGVSSFIPVLSDFVIMTENNAKLFMTSPSTFEGLEGKATSYDALGGGKVHNTSTGLVHAAYPNEDDCFEAAKKLVDFMPENNLEGAISFECTDDLNRVDDALNSIVPEGSDTPIDMYAIISSVADNNDYFEIHKDYATNIITCFVRFDGITTGIIANNGLLCVEAAKKAGEFINICDAFNIPIVTFTDILGYEKSLDEETHGIVRYSAKLLYAFANATVPKINIVIRNGVGNAYLVMNSKHIGADIVYAWPSACIALLDKKAQVNIMNISESEYDDATNPYAIASKGYIDSVIVPSNTRKRILIALEMLLTKREVKMARKHSSVEF